MKNGSHVSRRIRVQGMILIVVTFIVGVLAGGATERIRASREKPMQLRRQMGELPPPFMRLGLSEEQRTEIAALFQQGRPLTDSILREVMPHLQALNDSIHGRIREILTPEQSAMLDEEYERRGMPPGGRSWQLRRPFPADSPPGERTRPRRPDR